MTKRQVVRLIVKLLGVYFIYEAVMSAWNWRRDGEFYEAHTNFYKAHKNF